jgi:hypothetical protein
MRIVDRRFIDKNIATTRTRQHFGSLLGEKPHVMGQVVRMYPRLTISNLTEGLRNVYTNKKQEGGFTPINSMAVQWTIDVNYIKKVRIVKDAVPTAGIFEVHLEEKYYNKNETFALENNQQLFVVAPPKMITSKDWKYMVKLVSNQGGTPSGDALKKGKLTRFRSNYHPELSVRGYVKYQFNTETHRNYLSKHRSSDVQSAEYAASQEYYVERNKKNAKNGKVEYEYYRLQKLEKDVLESYLWARENHLLFGVSNYDANGKCMLQDEKGQDISIGDGVIKQIERYCEKFSYSVLTTRWIEDAMAAMREKSPNSIGNTFAFIVNERLYDQLGRVLREDLRFVGKGNDKHYWTNKDGKKIQVGAHYDSYTFQGNTVVFMVDKILSDEYPYSGYGFCINAGVDQTNSTSGISMFTLEGREMLSGKLRGMGGFSGKENGVDLATSVDGSEFHLLGYSGAVVFNPYNAVIIKESVI